MMTRDRKAQEITTISEKFGRSKAAFLVDFKGMDVENVTKLRKSLRPVESEMKVVRNTLALRALSDHPEMKGALETEFVGTNAIVFAYNEPSAAAKALKEFGKEVEAFQIKSGAMDGVKMSEAAVMQLADLPGKDELRAMLLAVFAAPMTKFLGTAQAVPAGFARALNAYKETKSN
ncbi:MAG TPA: 50S ribosomal protein L10 [Bdellovibrionales bacterium]|nr:50S ribosomal protein L10 [Pseudobdellovibrionaceae bacterium]HAG90855.1 50S ribosomal protein L10 [Bdellovibrionales bacterium]|tara:strand:+ start:538 stop:1065 length:528 start_codon:yes stop_codon:yes gene_type:complete